MENRKKILLLCGGAFAFKTLQVLANEKYLCAVGIGQGKKLIVQSLEDACENQEIMFKSFPNREKVSELKNWLDEVQPDFIFSVSFPFLIPAEALVFGEEKFINFHPGPLPQYRGAMPIFEVLKNQESETAICAHLMNSKFDEGNIIFNDPIRIEKEETYGTLSNRMSERMSQVVLNMADMLQFGSKIPNEPQDDSQACYYEKPEITDTYIKWNSMNASQILSLIHACNPWNEGADTTLDGKPAKIIEAKISDNSHDCDTPGLIVSINPDQEIEVACLDNQMISVSIIKTENGIHTVQRNKTNFKINQQFFQ